MNTCKTLLCKCAQVDLRKTQGKFHGRLITSVDICPGGEMADTPALGAGTRKGVEVQVLSWAPVDS